MDKLISSNFKNSTTNCKQTAKQVENKITKDGLTLQMLVSILRELKNIETPITLKMNDNIILLTILKKLLLNKPKIGYIAIKKYIEIKIKILTNQLKYSLAIFSKSTTNKNKQTETAIKMKAVIKLVYILNFITLKRFSKIKTNKIKFKATKNPNVTLEIILSNLIFLLIFILHHNTHW